MRIEPFSDDPHLTDSFLRFGRELYRGDPRWIPPLEKPLREQLLPSSKFCRKPGNDLRHFLALEGGRPVGRVSAMVNSDLHADATPIGTVGFFECIDDSAVAASLFDTARDWLRGAHGIEQLWGPMNFDIWHEYRLMTRGFECQPFQGEPYNKEYYPDLFTEYGWRPAREWESVDLDTRGIDRAIAWSAERHRDHLKRGYRFEPFDTTRFDAEIALLHEALSTSFSSFLGYTPISAEDFVRMFAKLRHALVPRWFTFVYDPNGELAGFAGAFADLGDALRAMGGRTDFFARLRFAYRRRKTERAIFYIIGLTPAEAARGDGLGAACVRQVALGLRADGISSLVAALMPKEARSRSLVSGHEGEAAQRQYALYEVGS